MNINSIINEVIASLICTLIVFIVSITINFFKKKYKENQELFIINFKFYFSRLGLLFVSYHWFCNSFSLYFVLPFVVDFVCVALAFKDAIKYNSYNSK